MQSWFKEYRLADRFYRIAMSPSFLFKQRDMRRWGILHMMMAKEIGLDESDPEYFDKFIELSDIFRELTDRLGRLPHKDEFLMAWRSWLMYKDLSQVEETKDSLDEV